MPAFKVFDATRTRKKIVIAECLKDLLEKAAIKLESCVENGKIVLEEDGTDIDGDEELCAFPQSTLMFLKESEVWSPVVTVESKSLSAKPSSFCSIQSDESSITSGVQSNQNTDCETQPEKKEFRNSSRNCVGPNTPIPPLSEYVIQKIREGLIELVWRQLINECAQYYLTHFPEIGDKTEYRDIGQNMFRIYPEISHIGTEKWTHFVTCLSQRIRHIRFSNKRKSITLTKGTETVVTKRARFEELTNQELPEDEYVKHVDEMRSEWTKSKPRHSHVSVLLKDTFYNRRKWIASLPHGKMTDIWEKFPCFGNGKFVFIEFLMLLSCGADCLQMVERLQNIYKQFADTVPSTSQGTETERFLELWFWMEQQTGYKKGKGPKTKPVITIKKDIPTDNIEKECSSEPSSAPRLIVFMSDDGCLEEAVVVGDQVQVFTEVKNIYEAVICLLAVYYISDLGYPKIYSSILGLIQNFVLKDSYTEEKSANYKMFVKKYENILSPQD